MTIKQSEIWLVNLEPTIGSEIKKVRPCIVISDDVIGKLQSKTVLPITGWSEFYKDIPWMIECRKTKENNLIKDSAIDAFQIRNISIKRFIKRVGSIDSELLFKVHLAVTKTLSIRYKIVID